MLLFQCSVWAKRKGDNVMSFATETRENVLNVFECVEQYYWRFLFYILKHEYTTVFFTLKHW